MGGRRCRHDWWQKGNGVHHYNNMPHVIHTVRKHNKLKTYAIWGSECGEWKCWRMIVSLRVMGDDDAWCERSGISLRHNSGSQFFFSFRIWNGDFKSRLLCPCNSVEYPCLARHCHTAQTRRELWLQQPWVSFVIASMQVLELRRTRWFLMVTCAIMRIRRMIQLRCNFQGVWGVKRKLRGLGTDWDHRLQPLCRASC